MFLNVMWLWARIRESHWQDKTNQTVQLWRWQGTGVVWRSNETGLPGIEKHVTVTVKWPDSNCTLQFQEKHVLKKQSNHLPILIRKPAKPGLMSLNKKNKQKHFKSISFLKFLSLMLNPLFHLRFIFAAVTPRADYNLLIR